MTDSSDTNLVPKPNQGLVRLSKSSLMSRGRELATRKNEIEQVKGYRCVMWGGVTGHDPSGLFTQISAGSAHFLGIREDGTIECWGRNDEGQCNAPDGVFTQVAGGAFHSIALREDGTVACWGRNHCDPPSGVFTQISAGAEHCMALRKDGRVVCWGWNGSGQCDAPMGVFTQVAAGGSHSLGIRKDGTVACWGWNDDGQCDAPDGVFTYVSGGGSHSVGIRQDGTVACWGDNEWGQCTVPFLPEMCSDGHVVREPSGRPMERRLLFRQISAGCDHSVGLLEDGKLIEWGCNWDHWLLRPPDGVFMQVASGEDCIVGLIVD